MLTPPIYCWLAAWLADCIEHTIRYRKLNEQVCKRKREKNREIKRQRTYGKLKTRTVTKRVTATSTTRRWWRRQRRHWYTHIEREEENVIMYERACAYVLKLCALVSTHNQRRTKSTNMYVNSARLDYINVCLYSKKNQRVRHGPRVAVNRVTGNTSDSVVAAAISVTADIALFTYRRKKERRKDLSEERRN